MRASSSSPAPFWTSCAKIGPSRRIVDNRRPRLIYIRLHTTYIPRAKRAVSGNENKGRAMTERSSRLLRDQRVGEGESPATEPVKGVPERDGEMRGSALPAK